MDNSSRCRALQKDQLAWRNDSVVHGARGDRVYGTNLEQVGPNMAKLDQLGQVGRAFAVFCPLGPAPLRL